MSEEPSAPIPRPRRRALLALIGASVLGATILVTSPTLLASTGSRDGSPGGAGVGNRVLTDAPIDAVAGEQPSEDVTCRVLDPNGNPVTEVHALSFGDLAYWLEFRSSGALATMVRFRTMPLFEGSPAMGQSQDFHTDFSNVVTTPFGVPDWGGNKTSGPWALVVRDNLGRSAVCRFEVVP